MIFEATPLYIFVRCGSGLGYCGGRSSSLWLGPWRLGPKEHKPKNPKLPKKPTETEERRSPIHFPKSRLFGPLGQGWASGEGPGSRFALWAELGPREIGDRPSDARRA